MQKKIFRLILLTSVILGAYIAAPLFLTGLGTFLISDQTPEHADAVVVLYTGVEYYPRLIEAAELYRQGYTSKVIINGDRKTGIVRNLEKKGLIRGCAWDDEYVRILNLLGVASKDIISISAEDVYDTVTESRILGPELLKRGMRKVLLTTSKYHSRRARYIWTHEFKDQLKIISVAAKTDPFQENGWWRSGRQMRWVMAEYGAWLFYTWRQMLNIDKG